MTCKTHPDAPHGFVRGASHSEDRYVCECEFWEEPKMNEKIKKLADQLGPVGTIGNWGRVNWADEVYPQHGDKLYASIDLEKFAELIVRECLDQCYNRGMNDELYAGQLRAAEYIEQHFGVEE